MWYMSKMVSWSMLWTFKNWVPEDYPFWRRSCPYWKGLKAISEGKYNVSSHPPPNSRASDERELKNSIKDKDSTFVALLQVIICCLKHVIKENQQIPDKILSIVDSAGQNEDQLKSPIIQRLPTSISQVDTQEGLSAQECPSQLDQDLATPPGIAAAPAQ